MGEDEDEEGREGERTWGWEDEMWNAMDIASAPELLVRTSGEIRFSDFMLWQVCYFILAFYIYFIIYIYINIIQTAFSYVIFLKVLWPDISLWHLLYVILLYQSNYSKLQVIQLKFSVFSCSFIYSLFF